MWPCFDQVLIIERTRKMSIVNVCVSLTCDPCCINVSLMFALPGLHPCCVTVLQYPVALKTLYLFRTHHVQDRQMVTTSTAKRRSIIACVYCELYQVSWAEPNSSMHDFSRLYLDCTGCRDGGVWR